MIPEVTHHPLSRADGSVTYSSNLFTTIAATNGPFEVQRRDELPEEAAIEVNVRSASGVGGPAERWLESVVSNVLRSVLLVHLHPRTLIQISLQITRTPELRIKRSIQDVAIIPTLLNASMLALIDGRLPLATTVCAGLGAVTKTKEVVVDPDEKELASCTSIHAFAYGLSGELLLSESCGAFDYEHWQEVEDGVALSCKAAMAAVDEEDEEMSNGDGVKSPWLRQTLEASARAVRT